MFLKNKNIIFKIRRSKDTDYAALTDTKEKAVLNIAFYDRKILVLAGYVRIRSLNLIIFFTLFISFTKNDSFP